LKICKNRRLAKGRRKMKNWKGKSISQKLPWKVANLKKVVTSKSVARIRARREPELSPGSAQ